MSNLILKTSGSSMYLYEPGSFNWLYQVREKINRYNGKEKIEYHLVNEDGIVIDDPQVVDELLTKKK